MKADEAAELLDQGHETDLFKRRCAIVIAVLAMFLAVTGLGGQNATKEALNTNIQASGLFAFYQAKTQRQTSIQLAADTLELAFVNDPALPDAVKATLKAKVEQYRRTVERYESEPDTREGKTELLARARAEEVKRDRALKQDPYFDYAETLLQIAIVLISVALVSDQRWLALGGIVLGGVGTLLMVDGFTLLVELPFLS